MNKIPKIRKSWIDIARGIGILLVLYGHVLGSDQTRFFIYAFHLPLFFFLSGMVFKEKHTESFLHFIIKNIKQILIPYLIFAAITYIYWLFVLEPTKQHNIYNEIHGILLANGDFPHLEFNAPLWFLPCFFVTKLLYGIILRISKKMPFRYGMLAILGIIGYLSTIYLRHTILPMSIEIAFTTTVFFGLGHLMIQNNKSKKIMRYKPLLLSITAIFITYLFAFINFTQSGHQIDTRINQYNNIFLFYGGAIAGIISVIAVSYAMKTNTILEYIGRKTMILYAWHYPIYLTIIKIIDPYWWAHDIFIKLFFPTLFTLIALSIILGIDRFIYTPLMQGQKDHNIKK